MSEDETPSIEAPTRVIRGYQDAIFSIAVLREHGVLIADFRQAPQDAREGIAILLNGAGLACGNSPFQLIEGVFFLTKDKMPFRREVEKYQKQL